MSLPKTTDIHFKTIDDLRQIGFEGFVSVSDLWKDSSKHLLFHHSKIVTTIIGLLQTGMIREIASKSMLAISHMIFILTVYFL